MSGSYHLQQLWAVTIPCLSSVYVISFVYCLRSTSVLRQKAQSLSATSFSVRDEQVIRHPSHHSPELPFQHRESDSASGSSYKERANYENPLEVVDIIDMFRPPPHADHQPKGRGEMR